MSPVLRTHAAPAQYHQTTARRGQCRFNEFDVHAAQPVFVLDHDGGRLRSADSRRALEREPFIPEAVSGRRPKPVTDGTIPLSRLTAQWPEGGAQQLIPLRPHRHAGTIPP